jgi:hypothetical protein
MGMEGEMEAAELNELRLQRSMEFGQIEKHIEVIGREVPEDIDFYGWTPSNELMRALVEIGVAARAIWELDKRIASRT